MASMNEDTRREAEEKAYNDYQNKQGIGMRNFKHQLREDDRKQRERKPYD